MIGLTTDPEDPGLNVTRLDGMQEKYLILSDEERAKGFVRPYRDSYIHRKCGVVTKMARELSETYARDPQFYGGTFCVGCGKHFCLKDENGSPAFLWESDGMAVGS